MNTELLLIITCIIGLCFICLLVLHFRIETQSKVLDNILEHNSSLLGVIKRMNADLGVLEESTFKEVKELERNVHVVEEGRMEDYCELKQEIREIHKAIEYLYEEKK